MAERDLTVRIIGDSRSLERAFTRSSKGAKTFTANMTTARNTTRNLFAGLGVAFGVREVFQQLRSMTDAASDLGEQVNKTNVVFGRNATQVRGWSQQTAESFGISQRAALEAAGGFGQMLRTAGLTTDTASKFSQSLVELASDMASFNNIDPTEALDKLRSGLAGEAEPLRRLGVLLSETRVQQEAYRSGIAKVGAKLTEQQKVLARYNLILQDTSLQQGDFARTSESLANQQRILDAQIENLRARLGQALLPAVTRTTRALTDWLSRTENQERVQRSFESALDAVATAARAFVAVIRTIAPIVKGASDIVGGFANLLKTLAGIFVAVKFARLLAGLGAIGTTAGTSATKVQLLRTALLRLSAIGLILIPIEIVVNRDKIDRAVRGPGGLLDDLRLGFLKGGAQLEVPTASLTSLRELRARMAEVKGEGDLMVQAIDKVIGRLEQLGNVAAGAQSRLTDVRDKIAGLSPVFRQAAADAAKANEAIGGGGGGITPEQRNRFFDDALARRLDRVQDISSLRGQLARLDEIARLIEQQIDKVKDVTRKLNLRDQLLDVRRQQAGIRQAIADAFIDSLQLGVERAALTQTLQDDLRALDALEAGVRAQIAASGRTNDLERELLSIEQQRQAILQQQRDAAREEARLRKEREQARREALAQQRQVRQFRQLGLTAEGQEPVLGVRGLRTRLAQLRERLKGTPLDTDKTRAQLRRIARVLAGEFGKVGRDVREAITSMFDEIAAGFDDAKAKGPLTKERVVDSDALLRGLGLTPEQLRLARSRLSKVTGGTTGPGGLPQRIPVDGRGLGGQNVGVQINGSVTVIADDPAEMQRQLQKKSRRRATQTTGPHAGNATGTTR